LTLRAVLLTFIFSIFFSVATIYTLVVLSFSMGIMGVVSVVLASSASIWGVNATTKNKVKPPSAQELAGMSWLSSAFTQSLGTTIVIGGVFLMRFILPPSMFSSWQRWWFAPAQSELGNIVAWLPTILFWMLVVFVVRLAVVGISLKFKQRYIDTDELPFPVAEGQADVIKELTLENEPPTPNLRYFLAGMIFALVFSLFAEHDWDYPLLAPLIATAAGIALLVGGMNNAFPWRVGTKLPKGLDKVAYYFSYAFLFVGALGLASCVYAPAGSLFHNLRFGFPTGGDLGYLARFIDLSFLVPQLGGLGFGVSISILLFVIGYLIPTDSSSGILLGSVTAFILIPLGGIGLTGSVDPALLYKIDFSLILAALLCATVVGSAVIIARTILANREGARLVILRGTMALYTLGEGRKTRTRAKGFQRLSGNVWVHYLLVWVPLAILSLIAILIVGMEPGTPWYLSVVILLFGFGITPLATTLGTWVASRTTRMPSQSPLPFLYEAVLLGTGVRELSPYAFGAPVVWQAPGLLSQLRVARLTKTESKVVYWADIIGFPVLGVMASFLVCIWVFSSIGMPGESLTPPGGVGSTPLGQWNFAPIWNALYTFIVWLAQGGGTTLIPENAVLFFLVSLIVLAVWTILHGFRRIPIASTAGIAIGFAVLPYIAITIFLGAVTATIVKRLKGIEWFTKYGITLGAGIYAGASITMFLIVVVAPLIP
jgi:hypothetical protein